MVFEYFASLKTPDGEVLMTPAELMRAVVPVFPPSESNRIREGFLRGETVPEELHCAPSRFFMLFDTNSDGLISFSEYIFFVTLLSIPELSFSVAFKMFDLDNNGVRRKPSSSSGLSFSSRFPFFSFLPMAPRKKAEEMKSMSSEKPATRRSARMTRSTARRFNVKLTELPTESGKKRKQGKAAESKEKKVKTQEKEEELISVNI
ncbi:hypothetical protein Peur_031191 [Populus x canadensis]